MSGPYSGNPANNPSAITLAADGDLKPIASVNTALEGLMDKAVHANLPEQDTSASYPIANQTINRVQRNTWRTDYQLDSGIYGAVWVPFGPTDMAQLLLESGNSEIFMDLEYMHGATLASIFVYVTGGAGHSGLPTNPVPTARVVRYKLSDGTSTTLATVGDPSASVGAYEVRHSIQVVLNEVIDNSQYRYIVSFTGEAAVIDDVFAHVGLHVHGVVAVGHTTILDKGAS